MSHSNPIRIVIVIIHLFALTLFNEQQFLSSAAKTTALSDARLKEIEKIRSDLNEAFEADQENVADQGVIVQPSWTSEQEQKPDPKIKAKVEVTQQRIDEVKALRDEISKGNAQQAENERQVQQLTKELNAQQAGREALEKVTGSARNQNNDDMVGAGEQTPPNGVPNVVESNSQDVHEFDIRKLRRLQLSKRRSREALILKSVEEDFTFNLGDDVHQWAHIQHNGTEYFVGRRERDLLIVHKESATYRPGTVVEVGQHISYLTTYSFWNDAQSQTEGVILVAQQDSVLWYRVSNVTQNVELYWQWIVGNTITGLTYFTVESKGYVVVSTNQSSYTGFYTLNIYQFDLGSREFWIAQRMQLEFPCTETTLLDTGRDLILAVPQNHTAAIYTFNPRTDSIDYLRFKLKQHIASEGVESVAGFKMGGHSYIAIGGQQPQILLYYQGELVPKTILAHNFGLVQLFFPVPVRTYRDDMILLVQHRVDFSTHSITVLETLIWDGEAFEASLPVPCQLGQHTVYGVSCMLDIQSNAGLKGAAYFRRGDEVSLVVPRNNAESGLFKLHTELLAKNSEYVDLREIFTFLQDWVKEQDDLMAQAQAFLQTTTANASQTQPDLTQLEELETPEFTFDAGEVGEIYVNDYHWTDEDTQLDLDHVITAIEQLAAEMNGARHRRDTAFDEYNFDHLEYDSLEVEEMVVQQVNGENFYVQNGMLEFDGLLNVQNLQVLERLSAAESREADDENEVEVESSEEESDTLVLDGDLEFVSINGLSWQALKENMVFMDAPLNLTQLEVEGEVIIEGKMSLNSLNSLDFPDDFLWSDGPTLSVVRGEKTFTNTLRVNVLDIEGLLNGLNTSNAVTLSGEQEWRGQPTFANLKVTEMFQLNGTTRGRDISNLPNNPTLKESNQIEAICNFKQLQVHGPIYLKGLYDGQSLESLLRDIVQRPADPQSTVTVYGKKRFSDVQMPLDFQVLDGKLNGIPVEHFVPAHTRQLLDISTLHAYVYFSNLTLSGRYNGVDLEELLKNAIRIDQPQLALDTYLNLTSALLSSEVDVTISLNGAPIAESYQTIDEDMNIPVAHFELLQANEADILGNIEGDSASWNMDPQAHSDEGSASTPTGNIYIEELKLAHGLDVDEIQGINASLIWSFLDEIDDLPEMVLDGKIVVDHVIVTGDVHVHKLNQQRFDEDLQLTIIWLNRPNYLNTRLTFSEPLVVHGKLQIDGTYNGKNLQALIDDIIFRESNNVTMEVLAPKSFTQRVQVVRDTHVEALNGIPFVDIATKKTICNFRGSLHIHGNLIVNELELTGTLNGHSMSDFSSAVRFDHALRNFIVQGVVNFGAQQLHLQDLTVRGQLNEMPNLAHFFDELVYKDKVCALKGGNTFTGRVSIHKGAYIRNLNGYNLLALFDNIVYVNEPYPVLIRAPVTFKNSVRVQNLFIENSLEATHLNGFALKEWFTDTLRLDKPQEIEQYVIFAPCSLNGNSFYASYLNDIDLSQVLTLHTPQNLTGNFTFSELHLDGQIYVKGAVNGVDLKEEYANTLMTRGNQHITTPLTLNSALVRGNLKTNAPINNNKDLREVATLSGDQHFESPLFFEDVIVREVKTKYRMSGINMDEWFRTTLRKSGKTQQLITGNWSARILNVNSGPILPSYLTSGRPQPMPFGAIIRSVREGKEYEDLCEQLNGLVKKQQRRGYQLKYLEQAFELKLNKIVKSLSDFTDKIQGVFALEKESANYLLINAGNQTLVLKWKPLSREYEKLTSFVSGRLQQAIAVEAVEMSRSNIIHFVTNTADVVGSLKYWRLEHTNLTLLTSFEQPAAELMFSAHTPGKLYALNKDILYAYDLRKLIHTNTWLLPNWLDNTNYRFVPHHTQTLMFTTGEVILHFDDNEFSARDKRTSAPHYSLPLSYQRIIRPKVYNLTEVVLKPNATHTHQFRLADFRIVIGHILEDLNYRLRLEVNITQLSIPETDLHDEHLMQDFIAIMEELRRQNIYPNTTFESIAWDVLQLPENPAQVLAARTVQILWPNIVEMYEIKGYLEGGDAADIASIVTIMDHLGTTVRDVLILANSKEDGAQLLEGDDAAAHAWELSAVIECIRSLQHYLENTVRALNAQALKETQPLATVEEDLEVSASALNTTDEIYIVENPTEFTHKNNTWLKFHNKNLPAPSAGEILPILVRAHTSEPLELLAVSAATPHLVGTQQEEVVLYLDILSGTRFQSISARKPRSLITLQIASETLFAFVEDCCGIRVFVYRGVQGFVEFANFESAANVLKIFAVMLQDSDGLLERPHLGVAHAEGVVFYRFVGAGSMLRISDNLLCN